VALLLTKGADADARDKAGRTPLVFAVQNNARDEVELLIAHGADVKAVDTSGLTPLHWARNAEVANLLLAKGADVSARALDGHTPLFFAAQHGAKAVVELYLAHGADAGAKTGDGLTSLHVASSGDVAEILIAKGADVNARTNGGQTPLQFAAAKGNRGVAELLVANKADVRAADSDGFTPLHAAKNKDITALLVAKGADVNARSRDGRTPLHMAVDGSAKDAVVLLLAAGADAKAKDDRGITPLHLARSTAIAGMLTEKGADVKARSKQGDTPLHVAASYGVTPEAKFLQSKGVEIDARNNAGMTPLFYAANKDVADFLLKQGADVNAKAEDGTTPLFYAHSDEVAALLAANGAKLDIAFREPEMVRIAAGSFEMGSKAGDVINEKPAHAVSIRAFAMGKTEVTQAEWRALMGYDPSQFRGPNLPVDSVSWADAQEYVKRLNQKTGKHYRLPSEAEWEYACQAGGHGKYCGGDDPDNIAWHGRDGSMEANSDGTTHPVGGKKPNAYGLYDMSGNVQEWVEDAYHDNYNGAPADGSAWGQSPATGAQHVVRGGAFASGAQSLHATYRGHSTWGNFYTGFRVAETQP